MLKSVVLFYSNNFAIWAKKVLDRQGIEVEIISVPRHLSSDCGYCLQVKREAVDCIQTMLKDQDIEYDRIENLEDL